MHDAVNHRTAAAYMDDDGPSSPAVIAELMMCRRYNDAEVTTEPPPSFRSPRLPAVYRRRLSADMLRVD